MDHEALALEQMVAVAVRVARKTRRVQVVMRGPGAWWLRDAGQAPREGYEWVVSATPLSTAEEVMGLCKRYHGRRQFAPTNLAVSDPRVKPAEAPKPPPVFYRATPDPEPATCRAGPDGVVRQARLFD